MPDTLICPSCGYANAAGATGCTQCNFPLAGPGDAVAMPPPVRTTAPSPPPPPLRRVDAAGSGETTLRRPARRARPQTAMTNQSMTLWLLFGVFSAAVLIYTAVKANMDRPGPPVEGSNAEQQKQFEEVRAAVARDSNDVRARVALGNLYYDTANWSDAIVQYRAALRRDSTLVHAVVDLGVCYYNLGNSVEAERHFLRGLALDPRQPIALFNLGIVSERRAEYPTAIDYFHRALQSDASGEIKQGVVAAMQRIQEKTGAAPKPLPPGPGAAPAQPGAGGR